MENKLARTLIITLICIILIVSVGGVVLYEFTDLMISKDVLFKKYAFQNLGDVVDILNITEEEKCVKLLKENDYNETSEITLKYKEKSNDKEEEYNYKEEGNIKNSTDESYRCATIEYQNEDLIKVESLNQDNIYGIRLSNLVQQFVSVENLNLPNLVSSLGYDGNKIADQLEDVDFTGIFDFSDSEISQLKNTYVNLIFSDIEKNCYSSKRNVMITLNNGKSITTTTYSLTITQNDLDKIYKKVLNQAAKDSIITQKLENIDSKIKELGIIVDEDETIKSRYSKKLSELADSIQYSGTNDNKIEITAYQVNRKNKRVGIKKADGSEILIDFDESDGTEVSIKTKEENDYGENETLYTFKKSIKNDNIERGFTYQTDSKNISVQTSTDKSDEGVSTKISAEYSDSNITSINIDGVLKNEISKNVSIPTSYKEQKNIIFNEYDGDKIKSLLNALKNREIKKLESVQTNINSKMLNNILVWIDSKEKEIIQAEQNDEEQKKKSFNNKFELYQGEELDYKYVESLLEVVGNNMDDYVAVSDKEIHVSIKENTTNTEKKKEISNWISDKEKYNIVMKYSDDGYINEIDIIVYEKNKK